MIRCIITPILAQWEMASEKKLDFTDIKLESLRLKSQATRLFIEQFILEKNKEISKVHVTGHSWAESTSDWWIPHTKGQ